MKTAEIEALGLSLADEVVAAADETVALRRLFHRVPELGHQEFATQKIVLEQLASAGIEARPLGGTGVSALISGRAPGRVLLLRADMDALPIQEETGLPYASGNPGLMHACGHDAHMAMLIAAGRLIAKRGLARGAVKLLFQPAEEGQGGASRMIEAGILESPTVDAALAFHVWSPSPTGEVSAPGGPVAAGVDGFRITVIGQGTHGAMPERGVDPILIASQIVTAAQAIRTRRIAATEPAVLSFTAIHGGSAFNVIPEKVELLGTFRTFSPAVRARLRDDLIALASSTARAFGGRAEYASLVENIPTVNDAGIAEQVRRAAAAVVGERRVAPGEPLMVSEDFGEILDRVPGCLVLLGCGDPAKGAGFPHHHPRFDIDERVLLIGLQAALEFVKRFDF